MTTRISLSVDPHVMSEEYIIAVGYGLSTMINNIRDQNS